MRKIVKTNQSRQPDFPLVLCLHACGVIHALEAGASTFAPVPGEDTRAGRFAPAQDIPLYERLSRARSTALSPGNSEECELTDDDDAAR